MSGFQILDTTIRSSIKTAIKTALPKVSRILDDDPYIPNTGAQLPIAFIALAGIDPSYDVDGVAVGQIGLWHRYEITYLAKKPTTGTLQAAKVTAANALLTQFFSGTLFASTYLREPGSISFETSLTAESAEPIYSVTVGFNILIISPEI